MINNRIEKINNFCDKIKIDPLINNINYDKNKYLDFEETIIKIHDGKKTEQLEYLYSDSHSFVFKGTLKTEEVINYAIKVIPNIKSNLLNDNNEINMYQLLSQFVISKQTPHIQLPIFTFISNIDIFLDNNMKYIFGEDNKKYMEFLENQKKNLYHDKVQVLVSEYSDNSNFLDFLKKYHDSYQFTLQHWKVFLFQIISTLAIIQSKYSSFRHNNLRTNNILITKIIDGPTYYNYNICGQNYSIPNIKYYCQISDFNLACIDKEEQNENNNRYYDLHYFLSNLIMSCSITQIVIPQEIREFINRIIPEKYQKLGNQFVNIKGQLKVLDEYILPKDILEKDVLFLDYREIENVCSDIIINQNEIINL